MKAWQILFIGLVAKSAFLSAQAPVTEPEPPKTNFDRQFYLGLEGLPTLNWLVSTDDPDQENPTKTRKPLFGYQAGIRAGTQLHPNWAFETGLSFAQLGGGTDLNFTLPTGSDSVVEVEDVFQYFRVPLLGRFTTNPSKRVQFLASFGLYVGILYSYKQSVDGVELPDTIGSSFDKRQDRWNVADIGAQVGVGVNVELSPRLQLEVQGRTNVSILQAEDPLLSDDRDAAPTRHIAAGLSVGLRYLFPYRAKNTSTSP